MNSYLYSEGTKNVAWSKAVISSPEMEEKSDHLYSHIQSNRNSQARWYTTKLIDMSEVESIIFDLWFDSDTSDTSWGSSLTLGCGNATGSHTTWSPYTFLNSKRRTITPDSHGANKRQEVDVDVSSLTGLYYVGASTWAYYDFYHTLKIHNVFLKYKGIDAKIKIGGSWKEYDKGWVKVDGTWKDIDQIFVKTNNVWKESQ